VIALLDQHICNTLVAIEGQIDLTQVDVAKECNLLTSLVVSRPPPPKSEANCDGCQDQ
jgi:hypothetical protein